jgi:hypothetical protein
MMLLVADEKKGSVCSIQFGSEDVLKLCREMENTWPSYMEALPAYP